MRPLALAAAFALFIVLAGSSAAQDAPAPTFGTWTYSTFDGVVSCGFLSGTRTLEDMLESERFQAEFPVYVFDDGESLLVAFAGDDYFFTRLDDGSYSGALVNLDEEAVSEVLLTPEDETHLLALEMYSPYEDCTYHYDNAYEWVSEDLPELWTETEREFSNYSFPTCLGLVGDTEPSGTWIRNDRFVPILTREDPDALVIGVDVYVADGASFVRTTDEIIAESNHHFEWTLTPVDEETITVDFLYQVDEREDCAIAYTSQYVRVPTDTSEAVAALVAPESP